MLLNILTRSKSAARSGDEEHDERNEGEPESKTTLNQSLETLYEVFPGGDIEEIRRLLATTSEESRLYVVTEMLLKKRTASSSARHARAKLEPWERFRTEEYQNAVKKAL